MFMSHAPSSFAPPSPRNSYSNYSSDDEPPSPSSISTTTQTTPPSPVIKPTPSPSTITTTTSSSSSISSTPNNTHSITHTTIPHLHVVKAVSKALFTASHLIFKASEYNRVDIINEVLSTLPSKNPLYIPYILEPSLDYPPWNNLLVTIAADPAAAGADSGLKDEYEEEDEEEEDYNPPQPFPPPLLVACLFGSVDAAAALLRNGADPSYRPTNLSKANRKYLNVSAWEMIGKGHLTEKVGSKLKNIAFAPEILRAVGADDVRRVGRFFDAGMTLEDFDGLVPSGGVIDFAESIQSPNVHRLFLDSSSPPSTSPSLSPSSSSSPSTSQSARLIKLPPSSTTSKIRLILESLTLYFHLSSALATLSEDASITTDLIAGGGSDALVSRVRNLNAINMQDEIDYNHKITLLVDALDEIESLTGDDGLRAEILDGHGEIILITTDSNEIGHYFSNLPNGEQALTEADLLKMTSSDLAFMLNKYEVKIATVKADVSDVAEEQKRKLVEINRLGLGGALRHFQKIRDEGKEQGVRTGTVEVQLKRVGRRLEELEGGDGDEEGEKEEVGGVVVAAAAAAAAAAATGSGEATRRIQPTATAPASSTGEEALCDLSEHKSTFFSVVVRLLTGVDLYMEPVEVLMKSHAEEKEIELNDELDRLVKMPDSDSNSNSSPSVEESGDGNGKGVTDVCESPQLPPDSPRLQSKAMSDLVL